MNYGTASSSIVYNTLGCQKANTFYYCQYYKNVEHTFYVIAFFVIFFSAQVFHI